MQNGVAIRTITYFDNRFEAGAAAMIRTMLNALMIFLAMVVVSSLISTMALFMGGGQGGVDLRELLVLQLLAIPVSVVAIVVAVASYKVRQLYDALPQWMAFSFFLLLLLVASGEVAFLIVSRSTDINVQWTAHAPLLSMLASALAICALYAYTRLQSGRPNPRSGRW